MKLRNSLLTLLALSTSFGLTGACGGSDDNAAGDGDGDAGDGDGDGDAGDGDAGDGDGDGGDGDGDAGDGDMGGATGDGDGEVQVVDCTVEEQADGSALISCPDGTELVIEPTEVGSMEDCLVERSAEGTFTVTCEGEDPVTFDPTPPTPALLNRALVKEGANLLVVEFFDGGVRRVRVPLPDTAGSVGFYSLSPDKSAVGYAFGGGLHVVDLSGDQPSQPLRADDGGVDGSGGVAFWQWAGNSGVYFSGDLETVDQYEMFYATFDGTTVGEQQKLSPPLIAEGDVVVSSETNPVASDAGVAFIADDQVDGQYELFYADVTEDPPVTTRVNGSLSAGEAAVFPSLLGPAGETLAFLQLPDIQGTPQIWDIMVSDVSSGIPSMARQVNEDLDGDSLHSVSYSSDGTKLAYARRSGGTSTVMVADVSGGLPSSPQPTNLSGPTTGLQTAFHTGNAYLTAYGDFNTAAQYDLYAIDVSGNQPADAIKLNHNLAASENLFSPQLSRVSERVVYGAGQSASTELFVVNLDGTGRERIDHGPANGQTLAAVGFATEADTYLYRVAEGSTDIAAYAIDLTADPIEAEPVFDSGGADITWCGLSPDGSLSVCAANGGLYQGPDITMAPIATSSSLLFLD